MALQLMARSPRGAGLIAPVPVATAVVAKWENELNEPIEEEAEFLTTVVAG
jgi:hypothetical protein